MTILYLRWLKKHVMQLGENPPIGAALCFEKYYKRVKLLQLEKVVFEFANL
ncbi:MAG: YhcG nuclease domain [Gammaproteobacteria bacterium]|nr:YhcG nuclease domain [Gammaproteobacteria bacterium]